MVPLAMAAVTVAQKAAVREGPRAMATAAVTVAQKVAVREGPRAVATAAVLVVAADTVAFPKAGVEGTKVVAVLVAAVKEVATAVDVTALEV